MTRLANADPSVLNHLGEIAQETTKDGVLQTVIHHIPEGWKISKRQVPVQIIPFSFIKDELSVSDRTVYRGEFKVIAHNSAEHSLESNQIIFNKFSQYGSKWFVVMVDCHFSTMRVGMKSPEAIYNTKHHFLGLTVAFFSFYQCS